MQCRPEGMQTVSFRDCNVTVKAPFALPLGGPCIAVLAVGARVVDKINHRTLSLSLPLPLPLPRPCPLSPLRGGRGVVLVGQKARRTLHVPRVVVPVQIGLDDRDHLRLRGVLRDDHTMRRTHRPNLALRHRVEVARHAVRRERVSLATHLHTEYRLNID